MVIGLALLTTLSSPGVVMVTPTLATSTRTTAEVAFWPAVSRATA